MSQIMVNRVERSILPLNKNTSHTDGLEVGWVEGDEVGTAEGGLQINRGEYLIHR